MTTDRVAVPPNFGRVHGVSGLLRSGTPSALTHDQRMAFAVRTGLRTVVCAAAEEPTVWWPPGVLTIRLPIYKPILTRGQWRIWKALLADPATHPILVHCHAGAERTGSLCAHAQAAAGVSPERVLRDLHGHGEGFWRAPFGADLEDLLRSLRALHRTGEVLPDAEVEQVLFRRGKRLVGDDVEASVLAVIAAQVLPGADDW